jgi:hypothetical protein
LSYVLLNNVEEREDKFMDPFIEYEAQAENDEDSDEYGGEADGKPQKRHVVF